jgi:membrane protein
MSSDRTGETSADWRGCEATGPANSPKPGLRDAFLRVKNAISEDNISLLAGGVAFNAFLSIFPAITALLSIYGLFAEPSQVAQQLGALQGTVPAPVLKIIQKQMSSIANGSGSALGIGLIVSLLIAIYSASKAMRALIVALNNVYNETEKRGFLKVKLVTLVFTFAAVCFVLLMLGVIGLPSYLQHAGIPAWLDAAIRVLRWIVMLGFMSVALTLVYALAPSRRPPRMKWVSPGAILAILVWLLASIGFSFYIANFGNYNKAYGSLAAIVILMLWFWIGTFMVLIGAELNAALEPTSRMDSTRGDHTRRCGRGAAATDEKGQSQ